MNSDPVSGGGGRRRFLKAAGLTAGGLLLPGAGYWAWRGSRPSGPLRIALLWPQATPASRQAADWKAGFELSTAGGEGLLGGRAFQLGVQAIGPAGAPFTSVREQLEQGTDIVIAGVGPGVAGQLKTLVEQHDATLVAAGIGVNMPRHDELSPHLLHAGSSQWQAEWALGAHAAQKLGRRGVMASSFYESGFDSGYAFRRGFEAAGGELRDSLVTVSAVELAEQMRRIAAHKPDFVYAAYTGRDAGDFLAAFGRAGLAAQVPLLGSGFMVDAPALARLGSATLGIRSAAPWLPALDLPANAAFMQAFQARYERPANEFSVLGYQTAQLLAAAIHEAGGDGRGARFRRALAGLRLDGPAGALSVQQSLGLASTPVYLREVRAAGGGFEHAFLGRLAEAGAVDPRRDPIFGNARSGWTNAYMCA